MCYDHSSLFHSSVQNFLASRARDRNRRPAALALLQRLARRPVHQPSRRLRPSRPKRLTSLDGQAGQGTVSTPRRRPTHPLLGSMWRKWLKVAAWTLAFLLSAGGNHTSHSEPFDNSLSLNDAPNIDRPSINRNLRSALEVPRHQHLATKISPLEVS